MATITARLARLALAVEWPTVPPAIQAETRAHFADTVGAWVAGRATLGGKMAGLLAAAGYVEAAGETGAVTVLPPAALALAGGAWSHCLEIDDVHEQAVVCPGAVVVPAAVAAARLAGAPGLPTLAAVLAGYEVAVRVALVLKGAERLAGGWWPTALAGPLGAAVAAARLLGLDTAGVVQALGIAGLQTGGLSAGSGEGPNGRHLLAGEAARRGLLAALAARAGWTGPTRLFEDPRGFAGQACDPAAWGAVLTDPQYHLAATAIKPYACARQIHAAVDGLTALLGARPADPAAVSAVTVRLPTACARVADRPDPPANAFTAAASAQFVLAHVALYGGCPPSAFTPERLRDPALLAFMARVQVLADPELDREFPRRWPAVVALAGAGGHQPVHVAAAPGGPDRPLSAEQRRDKFARLVQPVLGRQATAALWQQLAQVEDPAAWHAVTEELAVLPTPRVQSGAP